MRLVACFTCNLRTKYRVKVLNGLKPRTIVDSRSTRKIRLILRSVLWIKVRRLYRLIRHFPFHIRRRTRVPFYLGDSTKFTEHNEEVARQFGGSQGNVPTKASLKKQGEERMKKRGRERERARGAKVERKREKVKGEQTGRRYPTGCEHVLSALCTAPELWENFHTSEVSLALTYESRGFINISSRRTRKLRCSDSSRSRSGC